jgi:nitroimidazol reductase NimA-like FMN-containing flavoprotein (pyridoxamine 5'-phosphate oxidase superfamily)
MATASPTPRTTIKRLPARGTYERERIYRILDEGLVCHLGFTHEGSPFVIPTGYARVGDELYVHGSAASRTLRALAAGIEVCVTVTLLDGLVLARSAFHHSMNYRSVVVFGRAVPILEPAAKLVALRAIVEQLVPERWDQVRAPTAPELKATVVLALPLAEASAKVRSGPALDDEADYALPVWAGVIPLRLTAAAPIDDPRLTLGSPPTASVTDYQPHMSRRIRRADEYAPQR